MSVQQSRQRQTALRTSYVEDVPVVIAQVHSCRVVDGGLLELMAFLGAGGAI